MSIRSCNYRNYIYGENQRQKQREGQRECGLSIAACLAGKEECNDEEGYLLCLSPLQKSMIKPRLPSFSFIFPYQFAEHWESIHRETRDRTNHSFAQLSVESTQFCAWNLQTFFHPTVIILTDPCMHMCRKQAVISAISINQLGFVNYIQMRVLKSTRSPFNLSFCEEKRTRLLHNHQKL